MDQRLMLITRNKFAVILLWLCGAICVLVLFTFLGDWSFFSGFVDPTKTQQQLPFIPEAKTFSSTNESAFVLLALGVQANQMNCPAAVESLVRFGGWDGDVYMITDQENCFDEERIVRNAGMDPKKFHLTVMDEDFGGGGFDLTHPKVGSRKNRVRSFAMKARLFDVIQDPKIKTVAYVDCDILFGVEGCANEFINAGPSWDERKIKFSHLYTNKNGNFEGLHAGTMVAHREHSREVLKIWRDEIEKGTAEGDNDAYRAAFFRIQNEIYKQNDIKDTSVIKDNVLLKQFKTGDDVYSKLPPNILMPGELVKGNDHDHQVNWFEKFLEPDNATIHCMNHIPKARCVRYGRDSIQKFVDRFSLRTYENKYYYCTHDILQPLLYGWFPFSYLPFCPKMEQFL